MMSGKNMRKRVIMIISALCINVLLIICVVFKIRNHENDRVFDDQNNHSINVDEEESNHSTNNVEESANKEGKDGGDKVVSPSNQEQPKEHILSDEEIKEEMTEEGNVLSNDVGSEDMGCGGIVLPDDEWETP